MSKKGRAQGSSSKSRAAPSTTSGAKKSLTAGATSSAKSGAGVPGTKNGPGAGAKKKHAAVKSRKEVNNEDKLEQDGFVLVDEQDSGDEGTSSESEPEVDEAAVLKAMQQRWPSTIYAFYKPTPKIQYEGSRCAHIFKCANRGCDVTVRHFLDKKDHSSTSNLRAHAVKCWGPETVTAAAEVASVQVVRKEIVGSILKTGSITAHFEYKASQITYSTRQHSRTEMCVEIVKWVCESLRAFRIVEDPGFKVLMKTGRPGYYLPSTSTVARDVADVFQQSRSQIAKMLQEHEGALHFGTDAWTSPNHRAFVAVTVHFEQQGKPMCFLLDVIEVACSHTGVNLAAAFARILKEFGIDHKIKAVTWDNVSNNDTMVKELAMDKNLPVFEGIAARIRCFLHILNIVDGKNLVCLFDTRVQKKKGDGKEEDDLEIAELVVAAGAEDAPDEDAVEGKGAEEDEEQEYDPDVVLDGEEEVHAIGEMTAAEKAEFTLAVHPVKLLLAKIRMFTSKVVNSSTILLPAWKEAIALHGLLERLIPRNVRTRWNSTYNMLAMVLEYHLPYKQMCERTDNGLRGYKLLDEEWGVATQLEKVLKVFKHTTLFFSRTTPNLAQVIPVMDHIDKVLTNASRSNKYAKAIRVACGLAKEALNKYYSYMDMSDTYWITMMLHPSHKLQYFKKLWWTAEWQKTACELLQEEYERTYANNGNGEDDEMHEQDNDDEAPARGSKAASSVSSHEDVSESDEDDFDDLPDDENIFDALALITRLQVSEKGDELERYLAVPVEPTEDPLLWWADCRALYPRLFRMALDYLSITVGFVNHSDLQKAAQAVNINDDDAPFELTPGWDRVDVNVDRR
ncbi:hypothetical protein GSI_07142 [Ganoderma sinense ZZ0214-1]|uniref:HAT C-terminal dimerisation domain-containing protein n=1 Tax=Ganoderma sinense ZZ0214-1 TaxID=1077348 RepID=A0A2G8S9J7_9APHY|nr:hypothetical protein GSI_07142 [Ganoderma sinense ZZ0214-1]